jgi:outer membrane protein assembly factor BamB
MFGSDAQHTGTNTADHAVPPAVAVWSTAIAPGTALHPVTSEAGRVFVTYDVYFNAQSPLVALSVSDGSALWSYNFGAVASVGHPAVVGGTVYVQTNHGSGTSNSALWAMDAASGSVAWTAPFGSQWEHFWAPIVVGSTIFIDGGTYGGLYGFNTSNGGGQIFFNSSVGQYDSWSPAFYGGQVYTFIAGTIAARSPVDGSASWTLSTPWTWSGYSMNTTLVFGATLGYAIAPPSLIAFDPATHAKAWTAPAASYTATPAVADGVVYAISAGTLIAHDASTGAKLWTFVGDSALAYPPVVAGGYVYASSGAHVYAVDRATHAAAWTGAGGGWLAIASGRLLVAGADGILSGFVLTTP